MRLLLDTHTFLWWSSESRKLSPRALALCRDPANTLVLSIIVVWEIYVKVSLGKLSLKVPLPEMIERHQTMNQIEVLPLELPHVLALDQLPVHHKDPFDRLLLAQAYVEGATLVSRDAMFTQYPIDVQW